MAKCRRNGWEKFGGKLRRERDYGRRERRIDKKQPATIKLLLLLSFTVSLSKRPVRCISMVNILYCFPKKAKSIIYQKDEAIRLQSSRGDSYLKSFHKGLFLMAVCW